jgi:hypothetical protein
MIRSKYIMYSLNSTNFTLAENALEIPRPAAIMSYVEEVAQVACITA